MVSLNASAQDAIELEETPCPLCGVDAYHHVKRTCDFFVGLPGEYDVVRCDSCGHMYLNPRPTLAAIPLCYPDEYRPFQQSEDTGDVSTPDDGGSVSDHRPWWTRWGRFLPGARRFYRWLMRDDSNWVPKFDSVDSKALEVGCAVGDFFQSLRVQGWKVYGVEPAERPAEVARRKGFEVHTGTMESADWPEETFDAVFAWMVLEHLPDPIATLKRIRGVLKPNGHLVFSVPNAGSWERIVFGRYWLGYDVPRHLQHYTTTSLRRLLQQTGFSEIRVIHQSSSLYWIGSFGACLSERRMTAKLGEKLLEYFRNNPPLWLHLALAPWAKLAALLRQSGRLTLHARVDDVAPRKC